ncbi:MAG: radical SAM protein [Deltaproteobacteria bacterium]|nr:radical SAM protein [Deltaproteobacteria bacterium]
MSLDLLLVSPPVANFGQCSSGISVLTPYLRSRGFDVRAWDLAIDAFHSFHSPEYVARCLQKLEAAGGADEELLATARRVIGDIDEAKRALRRPDIARDHESMRWAFRTIGDVGIVMTAAAFGRYDHNFRAFTIPSAMASFGALEAAVRDPERNPYLAFLEEHALPRIAREQPKALGISVTYFSQLVPALTLAHLVREHLPEVKIVFGGAYLTAVDAEIETIPTSVMPAEAVILHDGEEALEQWLALVVRGEGSEDDLPNTWLNRGDRFRRAANRRSVRTDLTKLPIPMWSADGLELDKYLVPKYPIPLPLSRGCYWGRCEYCNISSQTAASYRTRPTAMAIADMRAAIAETGSNWFDFPVDSFRPRELHELAKAILAEGLEVEWGAEVLLDPNFTDEVLEELARSGLRCLRFGLESANAETRKAMNKPTGSAATRIMKACKANGVQTAVMLIAGFPTETQAQLRETYDYLAENSDCIDFVTIHPFSLVPGAPISHDPSKFGLYLLPEKSVMRTSLPFVSTNPVGMRNEDLPRVIEAMRDGLKEFYPDLGELWTVAIGGWMTFPACCVPSNGPKAN